MSEKPFTILIADDDLDDQALIRAGLKNCKIALQVDSLYDGVQVMDYLLRRHSFRNLQGPPDLLLLDMNMPLMDGFEVLKEIRSHAHLRELPVYVITTSRNPDHARKALDLGATGFYSKGSSAGDILRIMKEVCRECFEEAELPGREKKL